MEQETMEDTMDDTMEQELNIQNMADAFQAIATEIAKPNLQNTMADTFQTIATEIGNSNLQNMAGFTPANGYTGTKKLGVRAIPPNYPVDVEALGTPRLIKLMDYSLLIACQ
ncbi:unnamed protein product [Rhizophagus irregularis]|nr:unnamed protein product [Rhizophagus irregularis]